MLTRSVFDRLRESVCPRQDRVAHVKIEVASHTGDVVCRRVQARDTVPAELTQGLMIVEVTKHAQ